MGILATRLDYTRLFVLFWILQVVEVEAETPHTPLHQATLASATLKPRSPPNRIVLRKKTHWATWSPIEINRVNLLTAPNEILPLVMWIFGWLASQSPKVQQPDPEAIDPNEKNMFIDSQVSPNPFDPNPSPKLLSNISGHHASQHFSTTVFFNTFRRPIALLQHFSPTLPQDSCRVTLLQYSCPRLVSHDLPKYFSPTLFFKTCLDTIFFPNLTLLYNTYWPHSSSTLLYNTSLQHSSPRLFYSTTL